MRHTTLSGAGFIEFTNGEIFIPKSELPTKILKILYKRRRVKLDNGVRKMVL